MIDVVALGEILIDFATIAADSDGYPTMKAHAGGAPANFLATLSKYGVKTAFLGKVGDDAFGRMLLTTIKKTGIETKGIKIDPNYFTTLAFVTYDESGDRSFSFARKPGADTQITFEELDLDLINDAKIFHFGTLSLTDEPSRSATYRAVAYAKENGKLVTYDPNLRKPLWNDMENCKKQLLWGCGNADVIKISDEEVEFLFDCSPENGADILLNEYGVSLVMVTLGPKGAYLKNKNASCYVSCPEVNTVDTTGAGDIFGGSAVAQILKFGIHPSELTEEQLNAIGKFASTAASLSTEKFGGIPSVPEAEDVISRL